MNPWFSASLFYPGWSIINNRNPNSTQISLNDFGLSTKATVPLINSIIPEVVFNSAIFSRKSHFQNSEDLQTPSNRLLENRRFSEPVTNVYGSSRRKSREGRMFL